MDTEAQLNFSTGWGKRSRNSEIDGDINRNLCKFSQRKSILDGIIVNLCNVICVSNICINNISRIECVALVNYDEEFKTNIYIFFFLIY